MKTALIILLITFMGYSGNLEELFAKTVIQLPASKNKTERVTILKNHMKEVQAIKEKLPNEITREKEDVMLYYNLLSEVIERVDSFSRIDLIDSVYWWLNGAGGMKYKPTYAEMEPVGKMMIHLINAFYDETEKFECTEY